MGSKGRFIVFEGPDGAGKTTQIELLIRTLREQKLDLIDLREPGGTQVGEAVRRVMFDDPPLPMRALTWAFLMNAARAELVNSVIRPALDRGMIVLADRYWYSTLAYQSAGDGLDADTVLALCRLATGDLEPDLVLYLDVPAEVGLERKRRGTPNVLDRRPFDFHARVRDMYRELAAEDPKHWRVFDGTKQPELLADEIRVDALSVLDVASAVTR